jgi:hypothetical protein
VLHLADSLLPPVSAGQFTVPITVLQRAQTTGSAPIMADIV